VLRAGGDGRAGPRSAGGIGGRYALGHTKAKGKAFHDLKPVGAGADGRLAMSILVVLIVSKILLHDLPEQLLHFYLIHKFGLSVQASQVISLRLPVRHRRRHDCRWPDWANRFGRRAIIWVSILGVAPFSIALPYAGLTMTVVLSVFAGLIMASAFPAIIVFGAGAGAGPRRARRGAFLRLRVRRSSAIASAALGALADRTGN
jgi:FSR family fosmidomycin resistance protein-like MFS transporter